MTRRSRLVFEWALCMVCECAYKDPNGPWQEQGPPPWSTRLDRRSVVVHRPRKLPGNTRGEESCVRRPLWPAGAAPVSSHTSPVSRAHSANSPPRPRAAPTLRGAPDASPTLPRPRRPQRSRWGWTRGRCPPPRRASCSRGELSPRLGNSSAPASVAALFVLEMLTLYAAASGDGEDCSLGIMKPCLSQVLSRPDQHPGTRLPTCPGMSPHPQESPQVPLRLDFSS